MDFQRGMFWGFSEQLHGRCAALLWLAGWVWAALATMQLFAAFFYYSAR